MDEKITKEYPLTDVEGNEYEEKPLTETLNFNNPEYSFVPKGEHQWVQRGFYLTCNGCDLEHGVYIGNKHHLVGITKDNLPILQLIES